MYVLKVAKVSTRIPKCALQNRRIQICVLNNDIIEI